MNTKNPLPVLDVRCWQSIGVWGDRTCLELERATHCHNCHVFAAAGRRFLDAPSPSGYLDEWTHRLAEPEVCESGERFGALVFRIADEWLALPVEVLMEVTHVRFTHRIPHRGGVIAGLVNIRGELHLCARLELLLGVAAVDDSEQTQRRMIVVRSESEGWVFTVDEVDQVRHVVSKRVAAPPPTLGRAIARMTRGMFQSDGHRVGLLDVPTLFHTLRERLR